jgi:peptide deformylase
VKLKFNTTNGDSKEICAKDFKAAVIQHEYDHLNGILYVQRMNDMSKFGDRKEVKKYILANSPRVSDI